MKKIMKLTAFILLILVAQQAKSQTTGKAGLNKKITVAANTDYNKAGGVKRMFLGHHYRKEWATPVEVAVLNLDSAAGGLTVLKLGGGQQTRSLRMKGADGKEYVLRSVNKDPSKALPPELVGTFADDIVQDQISSSNPYAPLVVAELAAVAGIFHTTPQIVYVPESPRLGEFGKEFANTLCLFEERPEGNQEANRALGYSRKVINTEKMLEHIFNDLDNQVDEKAFLKARLFDMWIGDWDRHEDQWMWASFKDDGNTMYIPIPRDRDQAFASLDGIIPQIAAKPWFVRKTQHFNYKIRDINGLNMSAAFLDRNFTTRLYYQDWVDIVSQLQQQLTDQKIRTAFENMPAYIRAVSGEMVIAKLKQRRDDLLKYAKIYYHFLLKEVAITGSAKKEIFVINRLGHDSLSVSIYPSDKKGELSPAVYERIFTPAETKEIRLYGLGSDDEFHITGKKGKKILIRIVGGDGQDIVVNNLKSNGNPGKIKFYDDPANKTKVNGNVRQFISTDTLKNKYNRKSFRYDWLAPKIAPGYNPDDGLYIGGEIVFKKQQFGKAPFGYMQTIGGNYAFSSGAYNFWYEGIFKEVIGKWDLHLDARVNAPNFVFNYFGQGNETALYADNNNYNRVRSDQFIFSPSLSKQVGKHHVIKGGLNYQSIKVEKSEGRFVTEAGSKLKPADFEKKHFGGVKMNYVFNTTDNPLYPRKGVRLNTTAEYIQNLKENDMNFMRFSGDVSFYFSLRSLTAAVRAGAATNAGTDYEFYQANTLGGTSNLRGYRRTRFAGETTFYNNTELRLKLQEMKGYIFRGDWGLLTFFDNGRVWIPSESSSTWHNGYGGGVWYMPYNKMAFTATYGISKEDNVLNVKAGFLF